MECFFADERLPGDKTEPKVIITSAVLTTDGALIFIAANSYNGSYVASIYSQAIVNTIPPYTVTRAEIVDIEEICRQKPHKTPVMARIVGRAFDGSLLVTLGDPKADDGHQWTWKDGRLAGWTSIDRKAPTQ